MKKNTHLKRKDPALVKPQKLEAIKHEKGNTKSLFHVGEKKEEKTHIQLFSFNADTFQELENIKSIDDLPSFNPETHYWLNFHGLHDASLFEELGTRFGLSKLVLDAVLDTSLRPKIEFYPDYIYVRLKSMYVNPESGRTELEQMSFILGANFVISLQEKRQDIFQHIRKRIRNNDGGIRSLKTDYLLFTFFEAIIDNYYFALDRVDQRFFELQETIMNSSDSENIHQVLSNQKRLLVFKQNIGPLKEVMAGFTRVESKFIEPENLRYFNTLQDDVSYTYENLELYITLYNGLSDLHFANLSKTNNDVVQWLTIMSSIFIPITFICGLYGMNFEYMPELKYKYAYFMVLGFMFALSLVLLWNFWRKKWIKFK